MTYGSVGNPTREILARAGLLDAVTTYSDEEVIEVDIVFEGALDEVFAVDPLQAEDVAAVLFEAFCQDFPLLEFEVSVWNRTSPDDVHNLRTFGHANDGDLIYC